MVLLWGSLSDMESFSDLMGFWELGSYKHEGHQKHPEPVASEFTVKRMTSQSSRRTSKQGFIEIEKGIQ